eukprot:g73889.t1
MAQAEEIRTETGPLDYDYTEKEVELCQENLQNHKACSPDKIKNEMLNLDLPLRFLHFSFWTLNPTRLLLEHDTSGCLQKKASLQSQSRSTRPNSAFTNP